MKHSVPVWIITVLSLMLALGWAGSRFMPTAESTQKSTGEALIGGPFALVNGEGKTVTEKDFLGKYMLVFFGFTHCPDFCPTTLLLLQNALNDLGEEKAQKIATLFITIDPERDTPKIVGDYVANFGVNAIGLSGSPEQIRAVADAYKVFYSKITPDNHGAHAQHAQAQDDYMMDHSTFIFLMGPDGKYITHFPSTIAAPQLKDALAKAVR